MTYSYDPMKITDENFHRMRFELGDTEVRGKEQSCALCDEEYIAMIKLASQEKKGWKGAKLLCLKAIMMRYSHEVDSSIGGMSLSLSKRYETWKALYDELKKETSSAVPTVNKALLGADYNQGCGHYFHLGQHDNPRVSLAVSPFCRADQ